MEDIKCLGHCRVSARRGELGFPLFGGNGRHGDDFIGEIHPPLRFRSAKLVANVAAMLTIARCFVPKTALFSAEAMPNRSIPIIMKHA